MGLLAIVLGANGGVGVSIELGRLLLFVFLALAILTFLAALVTGRGTRAPNLFIGAALLASFGATASLSHLITQAFASDGIENSGTDLSKTAKILKRRTH